MFNMNKIERIFSEAMVKQDIVKIFNLQHQVSIGRYRVDFFIANKYIIEIDGAEYHEDMCDRENDYLRERRLIKEGYRVIRFTAKEVFENPYMVAKECSLILEHLMVYVDKLNSK